MSKAKDDPYHDIKVYHFANLFNERGGVSALCFKSPRSINLRRALWTVIPQYVTCAKCIKALASLPIDEQMKLQGTTNDRTD